MQLQCRSVERPDSSELPHLVPGAVGGIDVYPADERRLLKRRCRLPLEPSRRSYGPEASSKVAIGKLLGGCCQQLCSSCLVRR